MDWEWKEGEEEMKPGEIEAGLADTHTHTHTHTQKSGTCF